MARTTTQQKDKEKTNTGTPCLLGDVGTTRRGVCTGTTRRGICVGIGRRGVCFGGRGPVSGSFGPGSVFGPLLRGPFAGVDLAARGRTNTPTAASKIDPSWAKHGFSPRSRAATPSSESPTPRPATGVPFVTNNAFRYLDTSSTPRAKKTYSRGSGAMSRNTLPLRPTNVRAISGRPADRCKGVTFPATGEQGPRTRLVLDGDPLGDPKRQIKVSCSNKNDGPET